MLEAKTDVAVKQAVQKAGTAAISAAVKWACAELGAEGDLSYPWKAALSSSAETMLREKEGLEPLVLAFCAWLASPEIARGIRATRDDIQELANKPLNSLPSA